MNLLEKTIASVKSEKDLHIAVLRASAADIAKLERISDSIAAHGFPVTPTVYPITTGSGNFTSLALHVTASAGRAADLISLLEKKGITAERSESDSFDQKWQLTAYDTLPITIYIRYPYYPKKQAQAQEAAV